MATIDTEKQSVQISSRNKTRRIRFGFVVGVTILCLVLLVIINQASMQKKISQPQNDESGANDTGRRIEVSVLNASGIPGVAMRMTEHLRSRNYDVVESGNFEKSGIDSSFVMMWMNDSSTAKKIATAAGMQHPKFVLKQNAKVLVDFSVILGNDCLQLKPLRERGGLTNNIIQ